MIVKKGGAAEQLEQGMQVARFEALSGSMMTLREEIAIAEDAINHGEKASALAALGRMKRELEQMATVHDRASNAIEPTKKVG